jgi:hypothetical protein
MRLSRSTSRLVQLCPLALDDDKDILYSLMERSYAVNPSLLSQMCRVQ